MKYVINIENMSLLLFPGRNEGSGIKYKRNVSEYLKFGYFASTYAFLVNSFGNKKWKHTLDLKMILS